MREFNVRFVRSARKEIERLDATVVERVFSRIEAERNVSRSRPATPLEPCAGAGLERASMNEMRRGQVFDRDPQGFEDRDVVARHTSGDFAEKDFAHLAQQMRVTNGAFGARDQEIAGFVQARLATVRKEARPPDRFGVELAAGRKAGPDRVHMHTGREPVAE